MKLNYYKVKITVKSGLIYKVGNTYDCKEIAILAENEDRYCLNDELFTTIEKKKSDFHTSLNNPSISSSVNDSCWGTGVRYYLYSKKKIRKTTIKKQIESYIQEKYGAFGNIDLSFLND